MRQQLLQELAETRNTMARQRILRTLWHMDQRIARNAEITSLERVEQHERSLATA